MSGPLPVPVPAQYKAWSTSLRKAVRENMRAPSCRDGKVSSFAMTSPVTRRALNKALPKSRAGHCRRKFYDLVDSQKSQIAEQAVNYIGQLYQIEAECQTLPAQERQQLRQTHSKPIMDVLYQWLIAQRQRAPKGSPIFKAIHYTLKRWDALVRYLDDGNVPIDNNWVEN